MSAAVKLSSKLAADKELNGVDAMAADLVEDPAAIHVAVIWFDVRHVIEDTDSGDHIPTIRIRRFEPVGNVVNADKAFRAAVDKAMEARTGRKAIPFEIASSDEIPRPADPDGDPLPDA